MKSNRFISDHPEFGAFLKKELKQLGIPREAFRSTCHMKQSYLEDIKIEPEQLRRNVATILAVLTETEEFLTTLSNECSGSDN